MIVGCGNYNGESVSNNDLAFVVYVSYNGNLRIGVDANANYDGEAYVYWLILCQ